MSYWLVALLLTAFGFVTGFSIGAPFLLVGLAMLIFWPPLVGGHCVRRRRGPRRSAVLRRVRRRRDIAYRVREHRRANLVGNWPLQPSARGV